MYTNGYTFKCMNKVNNELGTCQQVLILYMKECMQDTWTAHPRTQAHIHKQAQKNLYTVLPISSENFLEFAVHSDVEFRQV